MTTVLLVEDEDLFARSVARRLRRENMAVTIASHIEQAKRILQQALPDILLLDVRLPDGNGLDVLAEIRAAENERLQQLPVIVITAYGEIDDAVFAMKSGATDYLKKPVDLDELVLVLSKALSGKQLQQKLNYSQVREQHVIDNTTMIGNSEAMQTLRQQLEKIASLLEKASEQPPVILLRGETGTGKDVAARLYHHYSCWQAQPFVHIDCASLPRDLIEAELFGYEQGAFTGAQKAKAGLIEVAEGGTVFLDEVGELSLELQAKLLNVLERRIVRRIGSTQEMVVKAHFVAATNRDLAQMVEQGLFRSDLYYRLNMLELYLPPLRERLADIPLLAKHFIAQAARRYGLQPPKLTASALSALHHYSWPGNIRELQHVIERAVMLCRDHKIRARDLLLDKASIPETSTSPVDIGHIFESMTLEQVEKQLIKQALQRSAGNVSKAARQLGLSRMAMRYRMEKYQLT